MNSTWNLDPIYTGFDDPAFASDLEALKKTVSDMTDLTAALDTAEPTEGLRGVSPSGSRAKSLLASWPTTPASGRLPIPKVRGGSAMAASWACIPVCRP